MIIKDKGILKYAMIEYRNGTPDAAVRSGSRPAPPDGRYLTGQKGSGRPLRTRPMAVYFFMVCRTVATCDRPPANCVYFMSLLRRSRI